MSETVERSTLDLRYQDHRTRDKAREARLLGSIGQRGIEQPLEGVDTPQGRILLNGFKRYRCAAKLQIASVPYISLGNDEALAIGTLMQPSKDKDLNILEQAKFVVELLTVQQMSLAEVAEMLGRSKAWVCVRKCLLEEMNEEIQQILLCGKFPMYSYMHALRPLMRINGIGQDQILRFIRAVAGQSLSVREIQLLADGYFDGPKDLQHALDQGKWSWALEKMKAVPADPDGCSDFERGVLNDLERLQKYLQMVPVKCQNQRLKSRAFFAQANLLTSGVLSMLDSFTQAMRKFYDRSGQT
jgi:hypothetical protein